MQFTVRVNGLSELQEKLQSFTSGADEIIQDALLNSVSRNVVVVAQALAPKRTGALAASISAENGDDPMSVLLVADKFYAPYMEYGTRPHLIEPKTARVLAFQKGSQTIFARSVHHPGIPEGKFSFMGPAIQEGLEQMSGDLLNAILDEFD